MPYAKNKIGVKVPKRSGFDKSHRETGSAKCGTLIPLLCDEVIPNSRVSLRIPISVQLPPLVSETYMNVRYKVEAFFVPMRLLCGSFESFFTDHPVQVLCETLNMYEHPDVVGILPFIKANQALDIGAGSLCDYLGGLPEDGTSDVSKIKLNPLPFAAYHLVYQEWYRNPRVQKACFVRPMDGVYLEQGSSAESSMVGAERIACMPFSFYSDTELNYPSDHATFTPINQITDLRLADGVSVFALRQRNFGLDYFSGARVDAQQGEASSVGFEVDESDKGSVTIAAIRAANSLQQFRERNNLPSPRMTDQVKARYGANLSDGVAQRPICIGTASFDVYSHGVSQTAEDTGEQSTATNPFSGVGAQYGRAVAQGNDFVIDSFVANEPGYILVLGSLVPEVTYSTGWNRLLRRYVDGSGTIVEMANPLLQNTGDQPIYDAELTGGDTFGNIFGYQDRYADFMYMPNRVHGLLRDGQSMDSFVLQRSFDPADRYWIDSEFLVIPTTYLDQVMTVKSSVSGLSYWYDAYLDYKVSMPLAEFSIPSLQDPAYEHGETVAIRRNGQIF